MEPFDYSTLSHFSHFYRTLCLLCSFCENFSTQPFVFSTWHTRVGSDGVLEKTFFAAQWENTFPPTKLARLHCMLPVPNTAGLPVLVVLAHINSEPPPTHSRAFFRAVIPWSWYRKSSTRAVWISRTSGGSLCCATRSIGAGKTSLLRWLT